MTESETQRADDRLADEYCRRYFGVEPIDATRAGVDPDGARQGDEDELFAAYMRQHFPRARARTTTAS